MHNNHYFNFDENLKLANPKVRVYLLKGVSMDSFHPSEFNANVEECETYLIRAVEAM